MRRVFTDFMKHQIDAERNFMQESGRIESRPELSPLIGDQNDFQYVLIYYVYLAYLVLYLPIWPICVCPLGPAVSSKMDSCTEVRVRVRGRTLSPLRLECLPNKYLVIGLYIN